MRFLPALPTSLREVADVVNSALRGRTVNYASVTLRANQTTTPVTQENISELSTITLSPRTANAAAALATTYVSAKANGSFTLTHANAASTDRTFDITWAG